MDPRPGEVWLADLGFAAKFRPVVIVSRHDPAAPRALITYVPITTQDRKSSYEVALPKAKFLERTSVANVQGIASLSLPRLQRKIGSLSPDTLNEIKKAIAWALDLSLPSEQG